MEVPKEHQGGALQLQLQLELQLQLQLQLQFQLQFRLQLQFQLKLQLQLLLQLQHMPMTAIKFLCSSTPFAISRQTRLSELTHVIVCASQLAANSVVAGVRFPPSDFGGQEMAANSGVPLMAIPQDEEVEVDPARLRSDGGKSMVYKMT
jgi:hypothetical protein